MVTKIERHSQFQQRRRESDAEGNPAGTHFAVGAMLALLAAICIYFTVVTTQDAAKSPVVGQVAPADAERTAHPDVQPQL